MYARKLAIGSTQRKPMLPPVRTANQHGTMVKERYLPAGLCGTYLRIDPSMAVMCSSVKYPLLSSMSEDMRSLLGS